MNREKIIEVLKNHNLDSDKYIVISGAAMVLYGIKKTTSDIDIAVTKEYYDYLLKNYKCTFERINEYNKEVYFIDDIINFAETYYSDNKSYVSEIPVQSKKDLLILKTKLNREKDKLDIKLIKESMNE